MKIDEVRHFVYELNAQKKLNCDYFFSHQGVNKDSGNINLFIRPNDPEKPDINRINIAFPETILTQTDEEIERVVKSELASYYIYNKAANR